MYVQFESVEELKVWMDNVCVRCAMQNRDCGHSDPCGNCKADRMYEQLKEELEKRGNK